MINNRFCCWVWEFIGDEELIIVSRRSFNCCSLNYGSSIPFLTFNFVTHTHKLNPSPYYRQLSKDREKLHTEIMKLHHKGWGYTKIHHHLKKNNYNIGNSRTTVDYIIKKRLERDRFFNQEITEEYNGFDIVFLPIGK